MSVRLSDIVKNLIILIFLTAVSSGSFVFSQTPLVTGINKYAKVTEVGLGYVVADDVSEFAVDDTVMIMQMAGVRINASPSLPGNYQNKVGSPGYYEIVIISSVNGGTGRIDFTRNLLRTYSPLGKVQIIKVRSYSNAVVNTELTCQDWDSLAVRGGVLAFLVKGILTLNADINVSGRGFKGGIVSQGRDTCQYLNDTIRNYSYSIWSKVSGYKGEGLAFQTHLNEPLYPSLMKGRGVNMTGGGGGNGHFSGGGGGSNYGAGSVGDIEVIGCGGGLFPGGNGGYSIGPTALNGGVFMGGGGGASVYLTTPTTSEGGRGGGIVIILADSIRGNGKVISAQGAEPNFNNVATAGAGGGGGGGSIIVSTRNFTTNPVMSAGGGKGGSTVTQNGAGGGGGGGLIWTKSAFTGTASVAGGAGGVHSTGDPDKDGLPGTILVNLSLPLNGFLFNAITSSRTRNQIDSICEGMVPPKMTGTQPTGGSGTYTYQWQRSYDGLNYNNVPGTGIDYTPATPETVSLWFRRVVNDGAGIIDYSKPVKIIVHPKITGNLVGQDTTICNGQNPEELYPTNSGPGGGTGLYFYSWQKSSDNVSWATADGTINLSRYDPPALTATQYYHRTVNSGACTDISTSVMVTVLPSIGSNTILADQTICQGSTFSNLTGSTPTGGASPSFTYLWKSSTDNVIWSPAAGTNSSIGYDPQNDAPGTYYYKRIVYSGLNNTCQDTSSSVVLISHPAITGNTILADQTICENSSPATLDGSVPGGGAGAGTYTYQWQNSLNGTSFTNISGITTEDLTGTPLSVSTWYRRVANSSVCTSNSNDIKVTVDPSINDFQISLVASGHDTICTGQTPALLTGTPSGGLGTYTYKWESSSDNTNYTDLLVATSEYQPGVLTATIWYRRTVFSGVCSESSTQKITVLPLIAGNTISADQRVCNTVAPSGLTGAALSGGDGKFRYLWQKKDAESPDWVSASGTNNTAAYQPPVLGGTTQFRRNVYSGENNCCSSVSPMVTVTVDTMPTNVTAGPDRTLLPYQFAVNLEGGFDGTGTCEWSTISSDGDPVFADVTSISSAVRKLGFGENIFEISVTNNTCVAEPEQVIINVPEVVIPEGITPNEDGLNDYFHVAGLEFTRNELVIINTGGAVVYRKTDYRSDDPADAWKGLDNYGDPVPEGTYYFLLTITGATDMSVPEYEAHISGYIILRR